MFHKYFLRHTFEHDAKKFYLLQARKNVSVRYSLLHFRVVGFFLTLLVKRLNLGTSAGKTNKNCGWRRAKKICTSVRDYLTFCSLGACGMWGTIQLFSKIVPFLFQGDAQFSHKFVTKIVKPAGLVAEFIFGWWIMSSWMKLVFSCFCVKSHRFRRSPFLGVLSRFLVGKNAGLKTSRSCSDSCYVQPRVESVLSGHNALVYHDCIHILDFCRWPLPNFSCATVFIFLSYSNIMMPCSIKKSDSAALTMSFSHFLLFVPSVALTINLTRICIFPGVCLAFVAGDGSVAPGPR